MLNPSEFRQQFDEHGFVVVERLLDLEEDLQPLVEDYEALLDRLAEEWYIAGKIPSAFRDLPFGQRLAAVISQSDEDLYRHFDISMPHGPIDEHTPIHLSEPVFNFLRNRRLLDQVEMLIGPEIYCNPIQHVRIKPPEAIVVNNPHQSNLVKTTTWHQDQGVARVEADATEMLTVWIAVTDATIENGCLCVVPGSHQTGLTTHCPVGDHGGLLSIPNKLIEENVVPLPMPAGSVLFMHRLTKHTSLTNKSDSIRWSFDLRYQPVGQPTGRDEFPGFVARSRRQPESALTDFGAWQALWADARRYLAEHGRPNRTNRWSEDNPVCA
ncbi:MAG: phytanoyl-CoA dioxygenase family protein [Anaerolineae bacterium]|nr:phytanoyl-CoA dioxygenase family protein [Anaerolineae bacterium]